MGKFKFGVSLRFTGTRGEWTTKCRRAETLGFDAITVPDHLGTGRLEPFTALAFAAAVTERPRLGTLVMNVPFYNLGLFARHAATTAVLADSRFDLGIGAGHMKSEFDEAGLPWTPARERVEYLGKSIDELRKYFEENETELPPLLIAGNSDGVLSLAARHSQIVGFAGLRQAPGKPPGTFHLDNAEAVDGRVAYFREQAGPRADDIESNMLVQKVVVTDDRRGAAEAWHKELHDLNLGVDDLLEAPQLLLGTVDEIVTQLITRRERYGFSYITVFEPAMEAMAPIVAELAGK